MNNTASSVATTNSVGQKDNKKITRIARISKNHTIVDGLQEQTNV